MHLPPCGLYRTTAAIGSIPSGRLVFFHNHGNPGPGLYRPAGWKANRVQLEEQGMTLDEPQEQMRHLEPLPPEGFYRVSEAFHCCEKRCRLFEIETLAVLGYNGNGQAILFTPELVDGVLAVPETGTAIDHEQLSRLKLLKVPVAGQREPGHAMH